MHLASGSRLRLHVFRWYSRSIPLINSFIIGCFCAVYLKIKWPGKHLGNQKRSKRDARPRHSITSWSDRKSPIHFHQEEGCAWVSPNTGHKGKLGVWEVEEGSKERLEASIWSMASGNIPGPTWGCPSPPWPPEKEDLGDVGEAQASAGQAAQPLS